MGSSSTTALKCENASAKNNKQATNNFNPPSLEIILEVEKVTDRWYNVDVYVKNLEDVSLTLDSVRDPPGGVMVYNSDDELVYESASLPITYVFSLEPCGEEGDTEHLYSGKFLGRDTTNEPLPDGSYKIYYSKLGGANDADELLKMLLKDSGLL